MSESTPESFDWCEVGMCTASWNQHIPEYCGSCYLHGALSTVNDRIKLMAKRNGLVVPDVILSRQTFLNCAPGVGVSTGCGGGVASDIFEYMKHYGLPDETCMPYNATDNRKYGDGNPKCPPIGYCMNCFLHFNNGEYDMNDPYCFPITDMVRYYVSDYGTVQGTEAMKNEIYKNGPIACIFTDFSDQPDGADNNATFDHLIEIVGWGTDQNGTDFWHGRNSWGTYWGQNGFFYIERGKNALRIEESCHWLTPNISELQEVVGLPARFSGGLWGIHKNVELLSSQTIGLSPADTDFEHVDSFLQSSWKSTFVVALVGMLVGFTVSQIITKIFQKRSHKSLLSRDLANSRRGATNYTLIN